jgi:hypothetical protein
MATHSNEIAATETHHPQRSTAIYDAVNGEMRPEKLRFRPFGAGRHQTER